MKQLWLFRICLVLTLFVAANRIFAFSDSNIKAKYTFQIQADEEEVDVIVPASPQIWEFKTVEFPIEVGQKAQIWINSSIQIPLFLRFLNLRL